MAKQSHFLEVALRTMLAEPRERNRLVFVSSLIKDKFKFDFEMVEREKLLYYYHKICEIGFTLGVPPPPFSAKSTHCTPIFPSRWPTSTYIYQRAARSSCRPFSSRSRHRSRSTMNTSTTTSKCWSAWRSRWITRDWSSTRSTGRSLRESCWPSSMRYC